jgi:hypothetical protein
MELFKLNEDFLVEMNKEWIQLHEPFKKIILRDKGNNSPHYKGRFKAKAQREFTYIYLLCDYRSNLMKWSEKDRKIEAKRVSGLSEDYNPDTDNDLQEAISHYKDIQDTRPLRLLRASMKNIDRMIESLDSSSENDTITLEEITENIKAMKEIKTLIKNLQDLEENIKKEMSETGLGRGGVELGENEL